MADGGIGNQSPASLFQARLLTANNIGPTLKLGQYNGNKVVVSGQTVNIPQTGLARDVADNLISAAGADSGAPGAANTLYYVYISNQKASFSPSSIRLSATPPSFVNGVKYLGNTGNALNWRFVGWVRLNATPNFESSDKNRLIINYYNRLNLPLRADASADFTTSTAPFTQVDPAGSLTVNFISNGEDSVSLGNNHLASSANTTIWAIGLGVDSVTVSSATGWGARSTANIFQSNPPSLEVSLAEGFHFGTLLFLNLSGGTINTTLTAIDPVGGTGEQATFVLGRVSG